MSISETLRNRLIAAGLQALKKSQDPVADPDFSDAVGLLGQGSGAVMTYVEALTNAYGDNPLPRGAARYYDEYVFGSDHQKCEVFDIYTANFLHDIQTWNAVGPAALIAFAHMVQVHTPHCVDFHSKHFLHSGFLEIRSQEYMHRGLKRR